MRFDNFVTESSPHSLYEKILYEKKTPPKSNISLLTLTNRKDDESKDNDLFRTAQRIDDICKKKNVPHYTVFAESAHILRESELHIIHNYDDKEGFKINSDNTVAIIRGSVGRYKSTMDLISQLERMGVFCINNRSTLEICSDKYRTMLSIVDSNLPTPKTSLIQDMNTLQYALEVVGDSFPLVVKTLTGSKGIGVFYVESLKSLNSILQMIWKINEDEELLIQQYIEIPFDIRVHVLGDEIIASMKRYVLENDFRSNFSLGGKVEKIKITKEEEEMCILASKAVGATWAAVDIVRDSKGNPFIIEVNSSPGTEGIEKSTKINLVGIVVDYALNSDNWVRVSKECGFRETIKIKGIGNFEAKFDTGNGSLCVLHSDKYEINEKKKIVVWHQGEKKYTNNYKEIKNVKVGGLRDYTEKRPVINVDISFDGILYKEVDIVLDDRKGRSPVLINRMFMRKANLMVNPSKRYVLSKEEK